MFIENIEFLMKQKGINKRTLSAQSGIPYTTIVSFWTVGCDNAKLSTIRKLADYFGVTLDFLIRGKATVVTPSEEIIVDAYRRHPELQDVIKRILMVDNPAPTIEQDIADTVMAEKNTVSN